MRISGIACAMLVFLVFCDVALAQDCISHPTQTDQIKCLQEKVDALRGEVGKLSESLAAAEKLNEEHLERLKNLMEKKIREATEPKLHHPF